VGCIFQIKIQFKLQGSARVLSGWGVTVDHVTIQRWVFKFTLSVGAGLRKRRITAGNSWRDEDSY
jgi:transposase-like protein